MKKIIAALCFSAVSAFALDVPLTLFPLENYPQSLSRWLPPDSPDYDKPLVSASYQKARTEDFYQHVYGEKSPWGSAYIEQQFQENDFNALETKMMDKYDNQFNTGHGVGYAENFRPHPVEWSRKIRKNIVFDDLTSGKYDSSKRGIAISNLHVRILPTDDLWLYSPTIAGEGFPFDVLQQSALWAGTPVYIVTQTKDKAWDFILTSSYYGWVHSEQIATVSDRFVKTWQANAHAATAAIVRTKTPVVNNEGAFQFYGYVGAVFPLLQKDAQQFTVLIPSRNEEGSAMIRYAKVASDDMAVIPLPATRHQFVNVMSTLLNRPYGWGGMYFYSDCSQELKSLFTPFGFWLPRDSKPQISAIKSIDLGQSSLDERLTYLKEKGHPLMTVVYIGGHVFLYTGNAQWQGDQVPIIYQQIWGMHPAGVNTRSVIGKTAIIPLLKEYPENNQWQSLAGRKLFQVGFLDEWP